MNIKIVFTAFIAGVIASSALADKVTLLSGSTLTGTAGAFDGAKLKFASDDLGDIVIPVEKIAKLEASNNHVIQYNDLTTETKPLSVVNGAIATPDGKTLDRSNVKAIDPVAEKWHGSVNLSFTTTRGNTVGESASVIADVSRRWEKDRFTAKAGYYYSASGDSKETKQKTESRFELEAQEDHFWTGNKFYTYINGKYETDRILELDYRYRIGLGLGYQWLENRDFGWGAMSFNQEIGMAYIFEKYKTLDDDGYGSFRYAHHYTWGISAIDGLAFAHNFEFLPAVDDWSGNYLIDADAGITYAFKANWQLIARVEWDYQKYVADGRKHSDIRYLLGLGYKW